MKNRTFKIVGAALALTALLSFQVSAVTTVFTVTAGAVWNSTNLVGSAKPLSVSRLLISTGNSGGATNLTYAITDFPGIDVTKGWGAIMRTNSGYMSVGSYLTNISKIVTNFGSGDGAGNYVTFTNTFTNALYTYTNYVGQYSNAWRVIAAGTVGSNSTATILSGDFPFIYGLGITNNNIGKDITVTVDYEPAL